MFLFNNVGIVQNSKHLKKYEVIDKEQSRNGNKLEEFALIAMKKQKIALEIAYREREKIS